MSDIRAGVVDIVTRAHPKTIPEVARRLDTGWDAVSSILEKLVIEGVVVQHGWDARGFACFWPPEQGQVEVDKAKALQ